VFNRKLFELIPLCCFICLVCCRDFSHSSSNRTELRFYTVGDGIKERFGPDFYKALDRLRGDTAQLDEFLLTIADQPLTKNQILERSGLSQSQVDYFITNLDSFKVIKNDNQGRWATVLPVITDKQMKIIRKDLAPMASSVAQYLKKEMKEIETFYDREKSPLDPSWEDMTHFIIDKFIIDGTFHSSINKLEREKNASERVGGPQRSTPAFFLEVGGKNFSNFGCNWYAFSLGSDQREVYVLHGAVLDRYDIAMNKYRRDQYFSACLFKISQEAGIHSLTDREKAMLRDLDWISGDRLLVPIVEADTVKSLLPMIENIGKDAAEVAFAKFQDITDSYNKSTYSKFLDNDEDYIQALIHSLFSLTIERLMRISTLPQIPVTVPESLGVYFVFGKLF
jgi:hypothetical protein